MKRAWIGLLLFLLVPAALGQKKVPRREDDRVIYDYARLLDAEAKESILKVIWPLFKAKRPIVILTINKLADWDATPEQVHEFSTLVYNRWGVGSRTTDNMGALIVVAKDDRKMSLIVGEGITGYRQEQAAPIINDVMGPNFKDGDFAGGIREGAIAIRDRIFQPKTSEDLSALPYETPPKNAAGDGGSTPSSGGTGGVPGDIGLPGPGNPNSGDPGSGVPGGTPPRPRPRDDRDQPPPGKSGPGFPGTNLHFNCGRWFCIAIGALVLLSLFKRRRQPTYGYGPQSGPPPPGYQHQNYQRGGGLGGMLGGILTGMLINSGGRRHSGGGGSFGGGGGGGSVFGGGGSSSGGSFGGGGSSGSWGGGGGGGGGFGGGSSSGGGASGSW